MQGAGAGPQTVSALRSLITVSAALPEQQPLPPKPVTPGIPPPDSIEQKRILAEITDNARNYSENLPNFICLQVTRRYGDNSGLENYRLIDTIAERLSYFEQKEDYKVVSVERRSHHRRLEARTTAGRDVLRRVRVHAARHLRVRDRNRFRLGALGHPARPPHVRVSIFTCGNPGRSTPSCRFREAHHCGRLSRADFRDRETGMVMRIKMECEGLPLDFPIPTVDLDMNYDFMKISASRFCCR